MIIDIDMEVMLFMDGIYGVWIFDWDILVGYYFDVIVIILGMWNGVEYFGISIVVVDEMFVCYVVGMLIDILGG